MRTVYFECAMGAAGDMLMGALYELCSEKERFLRDMNALLPGVTLEAERVRRQGIAGTHMRVAIHGREEGHPHHHENHHEHRSLTDIASMLEGFPLPESVRKRAGEVYTLIAQAESAAHGVDVGEVHFHEVGALDAVMDVTGVCYLMELLAPDRVCASPVAVGSGTVRTAHGLLPVPAPATAWLLSGVPVRTGDVEAELCTPTGAALLRTFVTEWGALPDGVVQDCGYGCGTKDFVRANCVRAFLVDALGEGEGPTDVVTELKAHIVDMTGEVLGFAMERLLEAGALDVAYIPAHMKKDRPGVVLVCLCRPGDGDRLAKEILKHTSTFGVRRTDCLRYAMKVSSERVETAFGPVARKTGEGYGQVKSKPEYEELADAARRGGVSLAEVQKHMP